MNSVRQNKHINLLIVEDEGVILGRLERLYLDIFAVQNLPVKITSASSLADAKQALANGNFHLLSLDLNLNGDSGFDLLQQACSHAGQTIIVSAYRDQALTAFEYGVMDFVPKPFSRQRLEKAINRFLEQPDGTLVIESATSIQKQTDTENETETETETRYLLVKSGSSLLRLKLQDIESIEGYGNYSKIHLQSGQEHLHEKGLENLLQILPDHFFRVHKSHLVNLHQFHELKSLGGGQFQLSTTSGRLIPVGRTRVEQLRQRV